MTERVCPSRMTTPGEARRKGPYHLLRTPTDLRNQDGKTPKSMEKVQQSARQVHQRVRAKMVVPGKGTWAKNTDRKQAKSLAVLLCKGMGGAKDAPCPSQRSS